MVVEFFFLLLLNQVWVQKKEGSTAYNAAICGFLLFMAMTNVPKRPDLIISMNKETILV